MNASRCGKKNILYGIRASLTRRKIRKFCKKLGNGRDAELHATIAELYQYLGEHSSAVESYHMAANSLSAHIPSPDTATSDRLIEMYKRILALSPSDHEAIQKLGQEYQHRGMDYRAISLYTTAAERVVLQGNYHNAITYYQRACAIEPGSITTRDACARLYCQIREYTRGAEEYTKIGDLYIEHRKFDGALEYYQRAAALLPDDPVIREKVGKAQRVLEGTILIQEQEHQYGFSPVRLQETSLLKQTLADKERIEHQLRNKLEGVEERYRKTVMKKNQQLQTTRERLEKFSTYIAVFKDNLERISEEKQQLQQQLESEWFHMSILEQKLTKLCTLEPQSWKSSALATEQAARVETSIQKLKQEKVKLTHRIHNTLHEHLKHVWQLREDLTLKASKESQCEQQVALIAREQQQTEQQAQEQVQAHIRQERSLQHQIKQLIQRHQQLMTDTEHERQRREQHYQATQTHIHHAEEQEMNVLEHLHNELSRQRHMENSFSKQFHESLGEITQLLRCQEQEIHKLEQLQP